LLRRGGAGVAERLRHARIDVGIPGERLVWGGEQVPQILGDPIRLLGGEFLEVILATEDGHRREVTVLVFDREVGDEARSLAGRLDIALLQCRAHRFRRSVQSVAADDRVDWLVLALCGCRNGTDAGRGK